MQSVVRSNPRCSYRRIVAENDRIQRVKLLVLTLAPLLLHAQELTEAQREFLESIDTALGARQGAVIADIGTGPALANPIRIAGKVGPTGKVVCVDVKS